jgi:hypothetical protein
MANSSGLRTLVGGSDGDEPVQLIVPEFRLNPIHRRHFDEIAEREDNPPPLYDKPGQREGGTAQEPILLIAANDLKAASSVADWLGAGGLRFRIATDLEAIELGYAFAGVAFGLTSNELTHAYVQRCSQSGRPSLFREVSADDGREAVQLIDGRMLKYEHDNCGLIARATPWPQRADLKWLFCAGVGPTGTIAAADFLCNNWQMLSDAVGAQDFVAVVRFESKNPAHATVDDEDIIRAKEYYSEGSL